MWTNCQFPLIFHCGMVGPADRHSSGESRQNRAKQTGQPRSQSMLHPVLNPPLSDVSGVHPGWPGAGSGHGGQHRGRKCV